MSQKPKLQARQFKNIKILTRNQAEVPSTHNKPEPIKKTVVLASNQVIRSEEQINVNPISSSENKSLENIHKRLKLKDYLYLNGIEKKNRSKSKISNHSQSSKTKTQGSIHPPPTNPPQQTITQETQIKIEFKKSPESNYTGMLKQQILSRIEQQKKKLGDLQDYLSKDFTPKDNMTDTFVFLFHIYNNINQIHSINEEVGASAIKYSKEAPKLKGKSKLLKKTTYHWEEEGELDSPAKIKSSNKNPFDLEAILKMAK